MWGLGGGQSNRGQGSGARTVDCLVTASDGDIFLHVLSKKEKLFFISQVCVSIVLVYRTGLMTPEPIAGVWSTNSAN